MKYDHLVSRIAYLTGHHEKVVRDVLFALPDVLVGLMEGEMVRTPMGVFRMMKRASRLVIPPLGMDKGVRVPAEMVVKMRAGARLRKTPSGRG